MGLFEAFFAYSMMVGRPVIAAFIWARFVEECVPRLFFCLVPGIRCWFVDAYARYDRPFRTTVDRCLWYFLSFVAIGGCVVVGLRLDGDEIVGECSPL